MKNSIRIAAFVFGGLFLTALVLSGLTIYRLSRFSSEKKSAEQAAYHFAVFLPENSYNFFHTVTQGARAAAEKSGCALSFHPVGNNSLDLEMARHTGIDGAVIYPSINAVDARAILEKMNQADISVVLVEHALSDIPPWPSVGTNNFDIGKKIGELVLAENRDAVQLTVVYSEKSPGILVEKELVGMGITSTLGKSLASPLKVKTTSLNPLDAEELTYRMMKDEPGINTIVFTDTNDTLAAVQVLIDMNLVGAVQIIGFGADETILDYIEKGVILGTIVTDPWTIGYNAVEVLVELREHGYSSGYVDTGVKIVTARNLAEFRKSRRER